MSDNQFATVVEKVVTAAYNNDVGDTAAYTELLLSLSFDELTMLVTLLLGWITHGNRAVLDALSAEDTVAALGKIANLTVLDLQLEGLLP